MNNALYYESLLTGLFSVIFCLYNFITIYVKFITMITKCFNVIVWLGFTVVCLWNTTTNYTNCLRVGLNIDSEIETVLLDAKTYLKIQNLQYYLIRIMNQTLGDSFPYFKWFPNCKRANCNQTISFSTYNRHIEICCIWVFMCCRHLFFVPIWKLSYILQI